MAEKAVGIDALTRFATEIMQTLGEKALSFYGKGKSDIKFDAALITEAELSLSAFFQDQLSARFPEHQLFSADHQISDYTHDDKRYLWILDPLDGAANFQAGIPMWGLSLALLENSWPIFGAFSMPATGDFFHARGGDKAFRDKKELRVSNQQQLDDESLLLTYSRFHQAYQPDFPGKIRNLGCTTAHVCYVAMGRAEAALIANESYKDIAAARIIIEAAGGKIYHANGSEFYPNEFLDGKSIEGHLLVTYPDISMQVAECLQKAQSH